MRPDSTIHIMLPIPRMKPKCISRNKTIALVYNNFIWKQKAKVSMSMGKNSPFTSGDEESKDVEELTNVGYVEELRRDFSIWSLGSLCLCLMGTVRILLPSTISTCLLSKTDTEIVNSGKHYAALWPQR